MFHVDSIKITGFWGRYTITTPLQPNVTFFIGENGTGKTTLINLIAAALSADFLTLDKLSFRTVEIKLRSKEDKRLPRITVSKKREKNTGLESIEYQVRRSAQATPVRFSLEDIEEQRMLRHRNRRFQQMYLRKNRRTRDFSSVLSELLSIVWLSIHRSTLLNEIDDNRLTERAYDSTVDLKLDELNGRISRYYSVLASQRDQSVQNFQEFIFLSLLENREDRLIIDSIDDESLTAQKNALVEAFQRLGVSNAKFGNKANVFFNRLKASHKKKKLNTSELQTLVAFQQIRMITRKWSEEKSKQDKIFGDFNSFINIMNKMLVRKQILISATSDLVATNDRRDDLSIFNLSSGEKQLLILLGEALLQNHSTCVYIADEPELSLHLKWQERIIPSILSLNENAQMIVATHSPDIIGSYVKNVVNMKDIVQDE